MFDEDSNVQLGGYLLKIYDPKLNIICGVEHTVSILFNYVSKIPIVKQMIRYHKAIYKIFGSGIYPNPHSIFKS